MKSTDLGLIFEIQKLSTEDGPGIRTTIFFNECPLRCVWCHNPESLDKTPSIQWFKDKCIACFSCQSICPNSAITFDSYGLQIDREKCQACGKCVEECPSTALKKIGEWWSIEDLYKEVAKDKVYYDKSNGGVTISGGEPTMQMDFLFAFLKKCKENGFSTALDTCCISSKKNYLKLLPYVDLFLIDIKEIDSLKHKKFVGLPNEKILDNIAWIAEKIDELGKKLWIRTPIIPRYTATDQNIQGIANFIVESLNNKIERWDLLAFNNLAKAKYKRMNLDWDLKDDALLSSEIMNHFYDIAIKAGVTKVKWSGMTRNAN